jgi:predicted RNA-binding protein YlqC (UPF0109 family)
MNSNSKLKDEMVSLMEEIIQAFTKHHDDLSISGTALHCSISIVIQGHTDDHPKIVGTKGQHILSIQTIFQYIGEMIDMPIRVKLLEPERGQRLPKPEFKNAPSWDHSDALELMKRINSMIFEKPVRVEVTSNEAATTFELFADSSSERDIALLAGPILQAYKFIFHAIGKANCRTVYIDSAMNNERD